LLLLRLGKGRIMESHLPEGEGGAEVLMVGVRILGVLLSELRKEMGGL
jgi:hypothetical protein